MPIPLKIKHLQELKGGSEIGPLRGYWGPKDDSLLCFYETISKTNVYELFSYLLFHMFCVLHFTSTFSFPRMFHKTQLRQWAFVLKKTYGIKLSFQ